MPLGVVFESKRVLRLKAALSRGMMTLVSGLEPVAKGPELQLKMSFALGLGKVGWGFGWLDVLKVKAGLLELVTVPWTSRQMAWVFTVRALVE